METIDFDGIGKLEESIMKNITELDVYRLAEKLSDMIWDAYDTWPVKAQYTVGHQMIRAADSVAANLAEGYGRFTLPDRRKFYYYSRGSLEETKAWLRKAVRRHLIPLEEAVAYKTLLAELSPKLNAFIRSTR